MARSEAICSNQDCRDRFTQLGLTYDDITEGEILALVLLLNREIRKSNKTGETSVNTTRLSKKIILKHKPTGQITECYLFMNSHYYTQRECISFNRDGFIGFAGWADDGNTNPIRRAFLEWCDILAAQKAATRPDPNTISIPLGEPTISDMLKSIPAADVRPVVLCKDCENSYKWAYEWSNEDGDNYRYCGYLRSKWNRDTDRMVDDDDFCKWGRKREES